MADMSEQDVDRQRAQHDVGRRRSCAEVGRPDFGRRLEIMSGSNTSGAGLQLI
jgi:hypothetical protein